MKNKKKFIFFFTACLTVLALLLFWHPWSTESQLVSSTDDDTSAPYKTETVSEAPTESNPSSFSETTDATSVPAPDEPPQSADSLPASEVQESSSTLHQTEGIIIPVFSEENMKKFEIPDNEALQFTRALKAGWNLGNTFDAHPNNDTFFSGTAMETSWVGTKTTKDLIHAIKEAGFNCIRLPVSWHNHVKGDDYTIDPDWLGRVKEVAQWIVDEDMYFIINIHHDNRDKFLFPDSKHYDQSEKYIREIWSQVAKEFADFDDHCIMESMNEPRLVGSSFEWWLNPNANECKDAVDCINRLNQVFVETVRASDGYNSTRYLMIPGYCASPDGVLSSLFRIPDDTVENRIILEVHAYTPYNYALNTSNPDHSFDLDKDQNKKTEISKFMNKLYEKFISKGIPGIIDEFGALQKSPEDLQDRVNFAAYYIASASTRGITCCWWDNHVFTGNGERFGLINRRNGEWKFPDIALAILRNCLYNRE